MQPAATVGLAPSPVRSEGEAPLAWGYWLIPAGLLLVGIVAALLVAGSKAAYPDWTSWTTLTPASRSALAGLRRAVAFRWHVIPMLLVVLYIYAVEIERRRWDQVFAGLALWGMDWFNELWNGLVLHFTQTSAVWTTPGHSAFILLPGLTIEISFMFAIAGVVFAKMLSPDRIRILGVPDRWF
jgi:hypothetical protein